jgi:hypothetical protein
MDRLSYKKIYFALVPKFPQSVFAFDPQQKHSLGTGHPFIFFIGEGAFSDMRSITLSIRAKNGLYHHCKLIPQASGFFMKIENLYEYSAKCF